MKTVYIVRHGKSSWNDSDLYDIDRPLKGRGVWNSYEMAKRLVKLKAKPELMLSSPADRALHTAVIFARVMEFPFHKLQITERLYEAGTDDYLQVLNELNDEQNSIMTFSHNPTLNNLLNRHTDTYIDNVPTAGVACLQFDVEKWSELNSESEADLIFFDFPKNKQED